MIIIAIIVLIYKESISYKLLLMTARSREDCWPKILDLLQRRRERTRESMIVNRFKPLTAQTTWSRKYTGWFHDS